MKLQVKLSQVNFGIKKNTILLGLYTPMII